MGNVEGRPVQHRQGLDVPRITSRPLPPLPNEDSEFLDDCYDLDLPPPYPPPPPPHDENGSKPKSVSWRFRDSNIFGGAKKGSWALNTQFDNEYLKGNNEKSKNVHNISDKSNLANTIALEDDSVITVSVTGTPDKGDLGSSSPEHANGLPRDVQQQSWALKNMQLILNSEMQSSSSNSAKHEPATNYPYPDVQNIPEEERPVLPDVVTGRNNLIMKRENILLMDEDLPAKELIRVEDVRLDYPEGKVQEISNYNLFDISMEKEEIETVKEEVVDSVEKFKAESDISTGKNTPKHKLKIGSCFGKQSKVLKSKNDYQGEPFNVSLSDSNNDSETENLDKSSSGLPSQFISAKAKSSKHVLKIDQEPNLSSKEEIPKSLKRKVDFGTCFGKSKSPKVAVVQTDTNLLSTSNDIATTGDGGIDRDCSEITEKEFVDPAISKSTEVTALASESDTSSTFTKEAKTKSPKKSTHGSKSLGSCFGRKKSLDHQFTANDSISIPNVETDLKFNLPLDQMKLEKPKIETDVRVDVQPPKISMDKSVTDIHNEDNVCLNIDPDFPVIGNTNASLAESIKIPDTVSSSHFDFPKVEISLEGKGPQINPELHIDENFSKINHKEPEISLLHNNLNIIEGCSAVDVETPTLSHNILLPTIKNDSSDQKLVVSDLEFLELPDLPNLTMENETNLPKNIDDRVEIVLPSHSIDIVNLVNVTDALKFPVVSSPSLEVFHSNIEVPKATFELDKPETEIPPGNVKLNIGSLGKSKTKSSKVKVETDIPIDKIDLSCDINTPGVKFDDVPLTIKNEMKKPNVKTKSSISSCFGKPKAPKVAAKVESDNTSPSLSLSSDVQSPEVELRVEGTADFPSPTLEAMIKKSNGKGKINLGSCLGKSNTKSPKVKIETDIPTATVGLSGDISTPDVDAGIDGDTVQPKITCDMMKPEIKKKKKNWFMLWKAKSSKILN